MVLNETDTDALAEVIDVLTENGFEVHEADVNSYQLNGVHETDMEIRVVKQAAQDDG